MITIRKSRDRGHLINDWLDTYHSFSFGNYLDPDHMGFRALRVINEDRIKPGKGFPTHAHAEMEIITYIVSGALEHKDSMENTTTVRRGVVQRMSAGTGIRHSERNPSDDKDVHLLQIWITPGEEGLTPSYEEKDFTKRLAPDAPCLIAAPKGANSEDGAVRINQDVFLYTCRMTHGSKQTFDIKPGRHLWLQLITGEMRESFGKVPRPGTSYKRLA